MLTKAQRAVIDKMKQGFEIAHSDGSCWMQKRIGHGGESIKVNANTAYALHRLGAFKKDRALYYGGEVHHLSEKGKRL
jgi:hypothetical protein